LIPQSRSVFAKIIGFTTRLRAFELAIDTIGRSRKSNRNTESEEEYAGKF
jgi:hypothetical protein